MVVSVDLEILRQVFQTVYGLYAYCAAAGEDCADWHICTDEENVSFGFE